MNVFETEDRLRIIFDAESEVSAMHMALAAANGACIDYKWRYIETDNMWWLTLDQESVPLFTACLRAAQLAVQHVLDRKPPHSIEKEVTE